ncbi:hypothetical protein [Pseudomonas sp. Irchel s3a18]|uniref:hypothetical protein n=1 Tax=Pseudomonas sp. Irchel s3a18 TaxID=2009053 RepID=UPI000BA2DA20|nr:hypothetical protein [Pseudomonas sp. Irchel s3a18]
MLLTKKIFTGLILISTYICTGLATAQTSPTTNTSAEASAYPDGIIQFFNEPEGGGAGDGKLKCSLTFVSGTYSFKDGDNACKGQWDDVTRIKVIGIPSASTFTLYDDESCANRDDQAFIYALKSVKNPTTTDLSIPIKSMVPTLAGQLLPGTSLRMEKNLSNRDPRDLLGCVRIQRSAVPENK